MNGNLLYKYYGYEPCNFVAVFLAVLCIVQLIQPGRASNDDFYIQAVSGTYNVKTHLITLNVADFPDKKWKMDPICGQTEYYPPGALTYSRQIKAQKSNSPLCSNCDISSYYTSYKNFVDCSYNPLTPNQYAFCWTFQLTGLMIDLTNTVVSYCAPFQYITTYTFTVLHTSVECRSRSTTFNSSKVLISRAAGIDTMMTMQTKNVLHFNSTLSVFKQYIDGIVPAVCTDVFCASNTFSLPTIPLVLSAWQPVPTDCVVDVHYSFLLENSTYSVLADNLLTIYCYSNCILTYPNVGFYKSGSVIFIYPFNAEDNTTCVSSNLDCLVGKIDCCPKEMLNFTVEVAGRHISVFENSTLYYYVDYTQLQQDNTLVIIGVVLIACFIIAGIFLIILHNSIKTLYLKY